MVARTELRLQRGRPGFNSWVGKIPWRRAWQPTPVFSPGESPWTVGSLAPVRGDSPGKNTGVGCGALLQGIFPTQESNLCFLCLLHWQMGSLLLVPVEDVVTSNCYANEAAASSQFLCPAHCGLMTGCRLALVHGAPMSTWH